MPEKKKQHYVPVSYLKKFSNNLDEKSIGLLLKNSGKFIPNSNLINQANEKYFYTKETEFEDILSKAESSLSIITNKINITLTLPVKGSEEFTKLIDATLLQLFRTKKMVNINNEQYDKMVKEKLETFIKSPKNTAKISKEMLDTVRIIDSNQALSNIKIAYEHLPSIFDLEYKLVINNSNTPFLTSDDPVVCYNQFLERKSYKYSGTALKSIGLQIFYPLNPKLLLIFYDPNVYKIDSKMKNEFLTSDSSIIEKFNLLQIINAEEAVYFNEKNSIDYLNRLLGKAMKYFGQKNTKVERTTDFNIYSKNDIRIKLKLDFISEKAITRSMKIEIPPIRPTSLPYSWEEFLKIRSKLGIKQ